jgi:lactoylglutathione lyase
MLGVNRATLYVEDQDTAKEFWTQKMGCELVQDTPYKPGERWLEVRTPDKAMILVLAPRVEGYDRPAAPDELPHSNLFFTADDIQETYEELSARGVEFPAPPSKQPWGWWSMFVDQDGTRFALNQRGE